VTISPGRPSAPSLLVVGRGIASALDGLTDGWLRWISSRQADGAELEPFKLRRTLRLIVALLGHMTGPLRRETRDTWFAATELFGRLAESRGLSAGEVVDEFQHVRGLLIVELGDLIVAMPARQQLPAVLRLNGVVDSGVSNAVVGYTDALVAKMFSRDGVPVPTADSLQELLGQLHGLEAELHLLDERTSAG